MERGGLSAPVRAVSLDGRVLGLANVLDLQSGIDHLDLVNGTVGIGNVIEVQEDLGLSAL